MPENIQIAISVLLLLSIFYNLFIKLKLSRSETKLSAAEAEGVKLDKALDSASQQREQLREEKYKMLNQLTQIETQHKNLQERFTEQITERKNDQERFEIIANRVLEQKAEKFDQQHKSGIKEILEPLKEKIKSFEERVERTNIDAVERHSALRNQIKHLSELNEKITHEAHNLTRALKSDTKKQGNWGELILESILDKSGLEKGREYHVQKSLNNEQGKRVQPDVIIDLPDSKKIIIDSKVSLTAYERFINSEDQKESETAIKEHLISMKKHIDELSAKCYHDLYTIDSPDFVLLFVPIETAFSAVLKYDDKLYDYAFEKNIVIVTPSTLLATLKTVDNLWKNEKQNKNAMQIAVEAGRMYDKFVLFIDDMEKMGKQLDTLRTTYHDSMNKMSSGKGNLLNRAEKLKKLGAKANKSISSRFVELVS